MIYSLLSNTLAGELVKVDWYERHRACVWLGPMTIGELVATPSREKGMGGSNRGRYSNPAMDAKLEEAMRTVDDKKREALLQEASRLVRTDFGILPLHFELSVWAMRKDLTYQARADQATLAQFVKPTTVTR